VQTAVAEGENETVMVGRFGPRSRITNGETIDVAVETGALHFFDLETGLGIYGNGKTQTKPTERGGEDA
jgi:multiple sugar transport system ATP-binding protein